MTGEEVPQDVLDAAQRGYSMHGAGLTANLIAAAWPAIARHIRERVAAETRAAAQAIEDSRGETRDPLAEEIWQTCRQEFYATCDDPRTIAAVAYRHIAHRIEEAR